MGLILLLFLELNVLAWVLLGVWNPWITGAFLLACSLPLFVYRELAAGAYLYFVKGSSASVTERWTYLIPLQCVGLALVCLYQGLYG